MFLYRCSKGLGALALVLACLLVPRIALAQFDAATVLGTVVDATGAVVPGATVTLRNTDTGITATTVTDGEGHYQFLNVRIGTYSAARGTAGLLRRRSPSNISVTVNARQRVDLTMKVGDIGETVQVTGAARLLESESSDRGQVIGREQIVNLPLNGRAYADLALLSPGVRKSSISESRDASFNVNGLRSSLNNFILDGVDNNSYGTSNQGFSNQVVQVSPDAVAGVQGPDQQLQRRVRARRRRRDQRHVPQRHQPVPRPRPGSSTATPMLNATGFFKPSSGVKPTLKRNQFGGVVRRPDRQGPGVLLRQLRRLPPGAADGDVRQHPDDGAAAGRCMGKAVRNPLTGEVYAERHRAADARSRRSPAQVLAGLPDPTRAGISNNFDTCRAARTTTTSSTSSSISRSTRRRARSCASAIARPTTSSRRRSRARPAARRTPSSTS